VKEGLVTIAELERQRRSREVYSVMLTGPLTRTSGRLSPAARRIMEELERGPVADHRELAASARTTLARLKKLQQQGLLELGPEGGARSLASSAPADGAAAWPELTAAQATVFDGLSARLEKREFGVVLLHGVTASGKTEIYLRLIRQCLDEGRTGLMLVPEIALTPALQELYSARLGARVAMLHSGMSELARHKEWWRVRNGEARVALGTRSAVYAPLENLGLVVVDEEHDASYKQQETPRYNGRDVAVVRGRIEKALVVLGSATPSLESYWNAREGKYQLARLEERFSGRPLASVEVVDMRREFRETVSRVPISRRLKEEIEVQLKSGAQTMILLNRRGFAWFLLCRSCGQSVRCANCSISLTYHRREHRLICHYCGYSEAVPSRCPSCASEFLNYVGEGTEKIEDKFGELFPGARVARLDRDVARRPAQFARILSDFRAGKIDILVGTQMVAKGHDFQGVTLVGVVSVDAGLALPDFRAAERTFQLLAQAAGRAGRGSAPGRVLVQTFYPEHYAVRFAAEQNYEAFFEKEIRFRRTMHYPPVTAFANIVAQDADIARAAKFARKAQEFFETVEPRSPELRILGPAPAPLARLEGKFRLQILLRSKSRARLHGTLERMADYCYRNGVPPRALMIDVDPASVM
jgi:primosomal protein N' (replication factor Y) (superfamily II helicase)